jgi:hypothetical protein
LPLRDLLASTRMLAHFAMMDGTRFGQLANRAITPSYDDGAKV